MTVLRIAGIRLELASDMPISNERLPDSYGEFISCDTVSSDVDAVTVRPIPGAPALPSGLQPLTVTGAWSMFQADRLRYLVWHGAEGGSLRWYAVFDSAAGSATVFCGDNAVQGVLSNPLRYPLDQILMIYALARRNGLILHAAGLSDGGAGLVCAGRSGAGKSTLARLWATQAGGALLSDDRVILRRMETPDSGWQAFGTPWPGELGAAQSHRVRPLALIFLRNAGTNALIPLSPRDALERLLPLASVPWYDQDIVPDALAVCEGVVTSLPAFEFAFTNDDRAVHALRDLLLRSAR